MLFARKFILRNCGRVTHIKSDFGSYYHTHLFLTSEALYAGMTREVTRREKFIDLKNDFYQFHKDYDLSKFPAWFSPGIFKNSDGEIKTDFTDFNVICETYPSTNKTYSYKKGELKESSRPNTVPTYGTIEGILPDQSLYTCGFSISEDYLKNFLEKQTFIMGKKRTMFQIISLSEIVPCILKEEGEVHLCQISHNDLTNFTEYEIIAATGRYIIVKGKYLGKIVEFEINNEKFGFPVISLPEFFCKQDF